MYIWLELQVISVAILSQKNCEIQINNRLLPDWRLPKKCGQEKNRAVFLSVPTRPLITLSKPNERNHANHGSVYWKTNPCLFYKCHGLFYVLTGCGTDCLLTPPKDNWWSIGAQLGTGLNGWLLFLPKSFFYSLWGVITPHKRRSNYSS